MSKLTLLGTGTCELLPHRLATSALIELDETRILFDIGRGIATRIAELGYRNDDIEHIVFSHFHPDHVSDLVPFLHAACWSRIDPRSKDLHIYGPKGVEVQIMRFLSLFEPDSITRPTFKVHIHEERSERLVVNGAVFDFIELPPCGNHGLRFSCRGKSYALTGDSSFHDQEVAFLKGVEGAIIDAGHLSYEEIIELAVRTQVSSLYCSHIYAPLIEDELARDARSAGFRGTIRVAHDRMVIEL